MKINYRAYCAVVLFAGQCLLPTTAIAVDSGTETYLLGSRDSMAGALPPPGTYRNNDFQSYPCDQPKVCELRSMDWVQLCLILPSLATAPFRSRETHRKI